MPTDIDTFAGDDFCYLTTTGRVTGQPHTIEIWFALDGPTLYMLSGGGAKADWVRNARRTPEVMVRLRDRRFAGRARIVADPEEDALARQIVTEKYQPGYDGDLSGWKQESLPVAVDLDLEQV